MKATSDILTRAKDTATTSAETANSKAQETLESVLTDFNKHMGVMIERLRGKDANRVMQTTQNAVSQHPWLLASGLAIGVGVGIGAMLLAKNKQ